MRHLIPDHDPEVHALGDGALADAARVVEQHLGAADMCEDRRQAAEVAEHRRHQRIVVQRVIEIKPVHHLHALRRQHRVAARVREP
ncbi:MAG: hypothetical protein V9E93_14810 [Steroidobacteraceae bacterium]